MLVDRSKLNIGVCSCVNSGNDLSGFEHCVGQLIVNVWEKPEHWGS